MARIVSIFQFTGRAGTAVGYKGKNGKIALRQHQPSVADPRTAAQLSNRAKLKLATGNWRHTSAMDTDTSISLGKSANESGDALEVFAYGIVLFPKTTEGFNNVGQTGANASGYVIDLDKLSTTNYDFSPCISTALNVSGNGGTTE